MKPLTLTAELRRAAERCVWFEPAEQAIRNPVNLIAHILTFGSIEDVNAVRAQLSDDDLREMLDSAPPGVFDARSWAYWNLTIGRYSTPPLPQRRFA